MASGVAPPLQTRVKPKRSDVLKCIHVRRITVATQVQQKQAKSAESFPDSPADTNAPGPARGPLEWMRVGLGVGGRSLGQPEFTSLLKPIISEAQRFNFRILLFWDVKAGTPPK